MPHLSTTRQQSPRMRQLRWVLGLNAVVGVPAYFCCFLFAYGFEDRESLEDHLTFLVLIGCFAIVTGIAGTSLAANGAPGPGPLPGGGPGVLMSLALNAAVVGAGSIVSAQHKAEGSVSAGFSTLTDVLVAAGLFAAALGFAVAAVRVGARPHHPRRR